MSLLTAKDRESILKVARLNERVAKTAIRQRSAELLANFERDLAAEFSFNDDAVWSQAVASAKEAVDAAQAEIAKRCQQLGIPKEFAPGITLGWYGRGQNAVAARRAELRRVAVTRIAAVEAEASAAIERQSAEVQTSLISRGLSSDDARALLATLPSVDALMPALSIRDVERKLLSDGGAS
mgnify:CR=1 FL=1